ncbi:N-acetylglucosamine-1-phosphodiester alpha-N-acetylglucosaminidase-like [Ostrea edulis]|uniref:N-acetylglucosamine-1-phosphodiester alpha-N-acetylglucosaminidase-like n=1 Tax=Ostrea edulis TaxID=37623 RepID=UPI00209474F4|nr:N-acetylglucosamine-1-phosphodiester alpha-N-acetylglucosaminidase-like [Ostrea edulis]
MHFTGMIIHPSAIVLVQVAYFATALSNKGICKRNATMQCCSNYFQVGNSCRECPPGFHGWNCSHPCPGEYYGPACNRKCECSIKDCDPKIGCLNHRVSTLHNADYIRYTETIEYQDNPDNSNDVMLSTRTIIILLGIGTSSALAFAIILEIRNYFHEPVRPSQFTGDVYAAVNDVCIDDNNETLSDLDSNND